MAKRTGARVDAAQRDAAALELRAGGASYRTIAEQLGVSVSTAWTCVDRGLARTRREPADHLRLLEAERLDRLQAQAVDVLQTRHVVVSGGKIVTGDDGQPLIDHGPTLAAVRTLVQVQESRRKLLGLDAPARADVKVDGTLTTDDAIDQELKQIEADLAALDPSYVADRQRKAEAARDLAGFRAKWGQPAQRPLADVAGFVADALELAVTQLGLADDDQEQLALEIERFLWERAR